MQERRNQVRFSTPFTYVFVCSARRYIQSVSEQNILLFNNYVTGSVLWGFEKVRTISYKIRFVENSKPLSTVQQIAPRTSEVVNTNMGF
jgi:hypothetical protein